ncbi:MAG: hypothetical protein NT159_24445 [Proteobacteria bacterium]|nr:hypothetical protein [Pseudomonadota bacterium]
MTAMDVIFADPVVVPEGERQYFIEEVRNLPSVIAGSSFPGELPEVNTLPATTGNGITFGSFNRLAKISDEAFAAWGRVLQVTPGSRLILKTRELDDRSSRERVTSYFSDSGIVEDRIVLIGKTTWLAHVATVSQVDIVLDSFPQCGGMTTREGLMMGVPVVTRRWPTQLGRASASMLTTLGLTDWIAESTEQYVVIAREKSRDITALAELRGRLRPRFTASVIGDASAYVKAVEEEYRTLWREWCGKSGVSH